jgi:hypothetical protein
MPDVYLDAESIGQKIKYMPDTDLVVVNEKNSLDRNITYTMAELDLIRDAVGEVTNQIHLVKKVFAGTIVDYKKPGS